MILEVRNINHSINDEKIFSDFSFYIRQKGCYMMQSNQSNSIDVLAELICGYQPIQQGEIILQGVPASSINPIYKSKILMVSSNPNLDHSLTVFENLYIWARLHYAENLNIKKIVDDLLKEFSLLDLSSAQISELKTEDVLKIKLVKCCLGHHNLILFNQINFSIFSDTLWAYKIIAHLQKQDKTLLFFSNYTNIPLKLNYAYQWKIEKGALSDLSF